MDHSPSQKKGDALILKERIIVVVAVAMAALFLYLRWDNGRLNRADVRVGDALVHAEVAETIGQHERGLSGRTRLGENEGMLFVFGIADRYPFWMKEMRFPIDIIWIAGDKVVDITRSLPPPREGEIPASAYPSTPADQVLEVSAGFADRHQINVGDEVRVQ